MAEGTPCFPRSALRRRILLVEDDEDTREALALSLGDALDAEVDTAADGAAALARLQEGYAYALVITDERMPRMRGSELLAWLAARQPHVGRVLMTAYHDGPEIARAARADAFLRKPFDSLALRSLLAPLLEPRRSRGAEGPLR